MKKHGLDNPVFRKDSMEDLKAKEKKKDAEQDDWNAAMPDMDLGPPWSELSTTEKASRIFWNTTKIMAVFTLLYFFICSLDLLSSAFKLISGKATSTLLGGKYLNNPIVGLMIGILLTVLVQSSSTSTSILVSMVSAGILSVHETIPIIIGTNVGTSVTNTIVSLAQVGDRNVFRRAFAGATVHDMFNWLSVFVILPLEIVFGILEKLTGAIVHSVAEGNGGEVEILKVITDPFTDMIIQIDGEVLNCWGLGMWMNMSTMIPEYCKFYAANVTEVATWSTALATADSYNDTLCVKNESIIGEPNSCMFLFYNTDMSDAQIGIILLVLSLVILCTALILIVKLLNSMLKGSIAVIIKTTINANIPYVPWLTGYIAILIGAFMTFIVQSSSIFTSTLTPLIGIGIITVERAYPLTLGSNLGTTTTALIASLAGTGQGLLDAVQIALVHLFFNVFGIMLYYPIPFMRFPIVLCKMLGNITARYRWFAILYIVTMFFFFPMVIFMLSLAGTAVFWGILTPCIALLIVVIIINLIQNHKPSILPNVLKNWDFVPEPLRSLRPYDKVMTSCPCCKSCRDVDDDEELSEVVQEISVSISSSESDEKKGIDNPGLNLHM